MPIKFLFAWACAAVVGSQVGGAVGAFIGALLALGWTVAICIDAEAERTHRRSEGKKV